MKVILEQDVKKLGKKGDVIEVSEGYARNYLIPRKLAIPGTEANLNVIKHQKAAEARKAQQILDEARVMASQLGKVDVKLAVKIGEGGRVFGSITSKDIQEALLAQYGVDVDKRKIEIKDNIKATGVYDVTLKLHPEVSAKIKVTVAAL